MAVPRHQEPDCRIKCIGVNDHWSTKSPSRMGKITHNLCYRYTHPQRPQKPNHFNGLIKVYIRPAYNVQPCKSIEHTADTLSRPNKTNRLRLPKTIRKRYSQDQIKNNRHGQIPHKDTTQPNKQTNRQSNNANPTLLFPTYVIGNCHTGNRPWRGTQMAYTPETDNQNIPQA